MTEEIVIRKAVDADLEVLLAMEQGVITAERPYDPTIKENPVHYYDLKDLMANPKALLLVALYKEKIVSCGYALEKAARSYLDHDTYAYLGFMFTVSDYRGHGINKLIIEGLKEWAYSQGLSEIRLTVYSDNHPAIRAYEKVGFKRHMIEMRIPNKQ
jgi:RimJ/RimL family protein N-acetyltransferase